ncbi:MAG: hypothetical protein CSA21_05415 [Deltaproteobacteria bacterium]|nr:MAG: hypothetical protein CSA21_05415 [Deltaproteobacteria bacterium]
MIVEVLVFPKTRYGVTLILPASGTAKKGSLVWLRNMMRDFPPDFQITVFEIAIPACSLYDLATQGYHPLVIYGKELYQIAT